jgi:hypothetical protein
MSFSGQENKVKAYIEWNARLGMGDYVSKY